jgi:hypothetical protein
LTARDRLVVGMGGGGRVQMIMIISAVITITVIMKTYGR